MSYYTTSQTNAINQDNRQMAAIGLPIGGGLEDIRADIATGAIGIESNAWDIDSLALGGGAFSQNEDGTVGLTWAYFAGRVYTGITVLSVAAGSIALAASQTNYVEVDRSGTVSSNTAGFTAGRCPLYIIVTGSAAIATVANVKALLTLIGNGAIVGAQLTAPGATKELAVNLGAILSATTISFTLIAPDVASNLVKLSFVTKTAVATDNANYWTFTLTNKGQAGAGTTAMLSATAVNTTAATGGTAIAAYTRWDLTLSGVGGALACAAGDVLEFTATSTTGAPVEMDECSLRAGFAFTA